ncbi:MAG: cytochrome c oxidase subunit 3 [Gammaproteobacteria bacterium]|nr:cytochrome c oxidase subunit 3 [Gammaproteobacteria bacterium]
MSQAHSDHYYIPHSTNWWPIFGSVGLTTLLGGFSILLNGHSVGAIAMWAGLAITLFMMIGWFGTVIRESEKQMYSAQVDISFRWGMFWFIFSEVMFFAAFFGALYYARTLSLPWLGGEGSGVATNEWLWPQFSNVWPSNGPGKIGGQYEAMGAMGIPLLNTIILVTSGATITWAHHALKAGHRRQLIAGLALTVLLGFAFIGFQAYEYIHAYHELNLTMASGIYGSTFYMLTGFHGAHVTIGAIMLAVILVRCIKGHFTPEKHFAFEAAAWYWHFVDVVWFGLFIFVYCL